MKKILFIFLTLSASRAWGYVVIYDTTTLDIKSSGYLMIDDSQKAAMAIKGLAVVEAKQSDALDGKLSHLRFDPVFGTIVSKSATEISSIDSASKKENIVAQVNSLVNYNNVLLQEAASGFDVSADTAAVKKQIDALQLQYQALP